MIKVTFLGYNCVVEKKQYNNRRTAIRLMEENTHEPIATATVNLPAELLEDDEVCIKNYSENNGILEVLINAGVISKPRRYTRSGHVEIPICKLIKET